MAEDSLTEQPTGQVRYSAGAILLHWLIAFAIVFELALGIAMPHDASGFALIQLHKSVGIAILLLSLARLGWRLTHKPPAAVEAGFTGFLAKAVHGLLYVFMIGQPLTGWALVSTDPLKLPTLLFGTISWPHLPLPGGLNGLMEESHEILGWTGVALVALHVAGALRHQFLIRNGLLRRIGPRGSGSLAALLALAALAIGVVTAVKVGGQATPDAARAPGAEQAAPTEATAPVASASEEATEEPAETAEIPSWAIQPGGRLGFVVAGAGETYRGSFSSWSGTIKMDPEKPEGSEIRIAVDLGSASLGDATMDATLHGPEFLASGNATWRSTSVTRSGPGKYVAKGTLTLKGVSRPQTVNFTLTGKGAKRHAEGSASIDRAAFGVGTGAAAEGLAASVSLSFSFDASQMP